MGFPYPWRGVKDPLAIPSGALRHGIQIQSQSTSQDGFGQESTTAWTTILSCMAAIDTQSMTEQYQGGFVSQVVHIITLRWPGESIAITAANRVVHGTHVYEIKAVDNVQKRNRVLRLLTVEIDGGVSS